MTDWKAAGVLADAHRVSSLARGKFQNTAKNAVRDWVIAEIASASPGRVLDLWGGGESADAMTDAGLRVVSVDDGRYFAKLGVSKPRAKRALHVCAVEKGYEWDWGPRVVARNAPLCQAIWLDLMGHLSADSAELLTLCRHMDAIGITLMVERVTGMEGGDRMLWETFYRSAFKTLLPDHRYVRVRSYKREGGHRVLVFVLMRSRPTVADRDLKTARERAMLADPDVRSHRYSLYRARWERDASDPERLERRRERERARRLSPRYQELRAAYEARLAADPERKARLNATRRERIARRKEQDPAYRERVRAYMREYQARRKSQERAA